MRVLNQIFRKDVTYDNIKSHQKTGFLPPFKRCIFGKTTGGTNWPPSLVSVKSSLFPVKNVMLEVTPYVTPNTTPSHTRSETSRLNENFIKEIKEKEKNINNKIFNEYLGS